DEITTPFKIKKHAGHPLSKNCPFPHAPIPEKTFALVMSPVPAAVRRAGMALCSRHGHDGDKRENAGKPLHKERLFSWWTPGKGKT
ncbi:hypothetical protein, partial [Desulfovibrio sp.]|uniref:hypothetical protein n=1 Tax=Desulfovibrio sp. TaxID=885 RepID=UPI00307CB465